MMTQSDQQLLVIDDDTIVRQSIVAYLEDSGYSVHEESEGQSGLQWFKDHNPSLVITDLRMPNMDGLSILKGVREFCPSTPVLVISGVGGVRDVVDALRHGASDFLLKPIVDMAVLIHSVERALEHRLLLEQNMRYRKELEKANRELSENVRILERDQIAGRQVQSQLLPKTPVRRAGLSVSYKIIPSLYLSGDFIDYGMISDRYFTFYLTDVSGHGAASAFVSVWIQQLVRRCFREYKLNGSEASFKQNPATLFKIINDEVLQSRIGCHMTCFSAVIDTHTNELRYVIGGHLPLPILIVNGETQYLEGKGKPLGIFEGSQWQVYSFQLPKDYSLVVFSDGVLEVMPPSQLLGKEKYLKDALVDHNGDIEDICEILGLGRLEAAPDDIAILKIESKSCS